MPHTLCFCVVVVVHILNNIKSKVQQHDIHDDDVLFKHNFKS